MAGLILYQFIASPYCAKVRWALEWKRLEYRAVEVSALSRRKVKRISGQGLVPVLSRDGTAVHDSTRILAWLDEVSPTRPLVPADLVARARALALEDWADEVFVPDMNGVRLLTGDNARRLIEQTLRHSEPGLMDSLLPRLAPPLVRAGARRKYLRGRSVEQIRAAYERHLDLLEGLASASEYLGGDAPSVFDAAVWGSLWTMRRMEGEELLESRAHLARWWRRLKNEI